MFPWISIIKSVGECSSCVSVGLNRIITGLRHFSSSSVTKEYHSMVKNGKLQRDNHQLEAVARLQELQNELEGYTPSSQTSWIGKVFGSGSDQSKVKGIYMFGSVGAGKTMLMDMFFKTASIVKKQRLHFNEFMMDTHKRIHRFKQNLPKPSGREKPHSYDPIGPVAREIASQVHLLCFDEFQVTDIGDAMILKRLFTALFDDGVVVVATSNRHPDELYKRGLQRGNFLPFINILKKNCHILKLSPDIDYRQIILKDAGGVYLSPNSLENNEKLEGLFRKFSEENGTKVSPKTLEFFGRQLHVWRTAGKIAYFSFPDLCDKPLSAVDYLEICRAFEIVFIQDVPRMTLHKRPQARRFITLVDTFYDHKVKLICTAAGSPVELFLQPTGEVGGATSDEARALMDDLGIEQRGAESQASIFTGEEELFAFARTVSRLTEMQGTEYWESDHIPPRQTDR